MDQKELIEKLVKKEPEAVRNLVRDYNRRLFGMVMRFVHHREDAEDVLQEAWIKFFNSLKDFKARSSLYTYLYRIVFNEALMHLRKNRFKRWFSLDYREKADENTPERIYLQNEKMRMVDESIQFLPARQKQVFLLRKSEALSFKEIAETLKIKENNAKVLFFHSLQKIRENLRKRGAL